MVTTNVAAQALGPSMLSPPPYLPHAPHVSNGAAVNQGSGGPGDGFAGGSDRLVSAGAGALRRTQSMTVG
jgi:hypothetical protein